MDYSAIEKILNSKVCKLSDMATIMHGFAEAIGLYIEIIHSSGQYECYGMNTSKEMLRFGDITPIYMIETDVNAKTSYLDVCLAIVEDLVSRDFDGEPSIVISKDRHTSEEILLKQMHLPIVVLDHSDIRSIFLNAKPKYKFYSLIKRKLGTEHILPYQYFGGVKGAMFVGRENELSKMRSSNENYAIFGYRRSGKTSLMYKSMEDYTKSGYSVFYFNCWRRSIESFFEQVTIKLDPNRSRRVTMTNFDRSLRKIGMSCKGRVIIYLDEIDTIIHEDISKYDCSLLNTLNLACSERWCRFITAGYRELYNNCIDKDSPLHTFMKPMLLAALDEASCRKLVRGPFENVGLEPLNEEIVQELMVLSGKQPALIQLFCRLLINYAEDHNKSEIGLNDLRQIETYDEYLYCIEETFLWNTNTSERVIVYVLLNDYQKGKRTFILSELFGQLHAEKWNVSLNELDKHIAYLTRSNIISRKSDNEISFSYDALPKTILKNLDIEFRKKNALKEVFREKQN